MAKMPIVSMSDFTPMKDGEQGVNGAELPKFGPGGIYHEKQIGSLCAVHALNNLLQGPIFDEMQFGEEAQRLDQEERRLMGGENLDYGNARADGFFNVQVIKAVLERMGFRLEPLAGESGKTALQNSANEKGYICNKREHWFALRRIGREWFDLNSCIKTPQHYTDADLRGHVSDAMREGYQVFVVRGDFPRTALEEDSSKLLEAVQGCGHHRQGHCLFAGQGQTLSQGASAPKAATADEMRAARLARLGGGGGGAGGPAPPQPAPPPAPAVPAAAPASAALKQLLEMGFPEEKAKAALEAGGGNADAAMDFLLSESS